MTKQLSIIIPVYNEGEIVNQVIEDLKKELIKIPDLEYEIIAINDASTDKTGDVLKEISGIQVINHPHNRGYGASLKTGFRKSKNDLILIIDADDTYPSESISDLLKNIDDYDMVVGARVGKNAKIPIIRKPAKWILNKLANYLTGTKIPDLNSGLRIMKKSLIEKFILFLPDGFSFTTTITLAALTNNYQIKYVPINYSKRIGRSKFRPIRDTLNFLQLIIRTILYFNPLKVFMPFSIILFLLAVIIFLWSYFFGPKVLDITIAMFILSSIQMLSIGMLADLLIKSHKQSCN